MIAAQKLRDLAISHSAGGDIMIMVVNMRGLFKPQARSSAGTRARRCLSYRRCTARLR
jgi:hypothetical protein